MPPLASLERSLIELARCAKLIGAPQRRSIAGVLQEPVLFSDSIRRNIVFAQPDLPLARALAGRPAVLLLDEATSHLDVVAEPT